MYVKNPVSCINTDNNFNIIGFNNTYNKSNIQINNYNNDVINNNHVIYHWNQNCAVIIKFCKC